MVLKSVSLSIGRRISALVSLAVCVAVLCVAGLLAIFQAQQAAEIKRSAVEGTAFVFASAVADHVESRRSYEIRTVLRSIDRVPGVISATVYTANGEVIASLGQRAILQSDMATENPGFWMMLKRGIAPVSVNVIKGGKTVGILVVFTDVSDLRQRFFQTLLAIFAASLAAAGAGFAFSLPLQRRITRPIAKLTQSMRDIRTSRDYTSLIKVESNDETGLMVESFNSLLSDIRSRDQSLQKLAYFDPLTGLPNRANFQKVLGEKLAALKSEAESLAVILLNMDSFHTYNDAFGHGIGDAILMNVAALIEKEASPETFVARVGGDEFALIVSDGGTGQQAELAVARVQAAFLKPLRFLELELHLTISVGATIMPRDSKSVGDAMRHVDLATNAAKKLGPGRAVFFQPHMDDVVRRETDLIQGLRSAIANKELQVHYQPQFHLGARKIVGFEALMRWKHPSLGFVSPAVFIPLAEKGGTINLLGEWILEESCRQARTWLDSGEEGRIMAVNVSPAQILKAGFVRKVGTILERTGLPPHLLCIELTESMFLGRSLQSVRSILEDLHGLGVTLALDDFGTGYSSLAYLSQLPFDKLKIDRSFVSSSDESPRRKEVLRSIIVMAHSLGMEVVCEGAETEGEIRLLRALNADQVQGYAIAKPAAAEAALEMVRHIEARTAPQPQQAIA